MTRTRRIAEAGIIMALYIAMNITLAPIASGLLQARFATGLYVLAAFRADLIIALGSANALSNLLVGLGPVDTALGLVVGLVTAAACWLLGRTGRLWLLPLPVAFLVPLVVAMWLHRLLNVPYWTSVGFLLGGQVLSAVTVGVAAAYYGRRFLSGGGGI